VLGRNDFVLILVPPASALTSVEPSSPGASSRWPPSCSGSAIWNSCCASAYYRQRTGREAPEAAVPHPTQPGRLHDPRLFPEADVGRLLAIPVRPLRAIILDVWRPLRIVSA